MIRRLAGSKLLRLFSTAVLDQALLSASSFVVGLLMIRHTSDADYGHYVLAFNALLLATSFQNSLIGGPLAVLAPRKSAADKQAMVATLYRLLLGVMRKLTPALLLLLPVAVYTLGMSREYGLLAAAFLVAMHAAVLREYLRVALLLYSRPQAVLAADAVYSALLLSGAVIAIWLFKPAAPAMLLVIAIASWGGSWLAWQRFGRDPGWVEKDVPNVLQEVLKLGYWGAAGALIYWVFNQGYSYLTAIRLDVAAVAGIAATRLLLMPVNLLAAGVKQLLMPTAAGWYGELGMRELLRRLALFSLGVLLLIGIYDVLLWVLRDWIITVVLKKDIPDLDALLGLWILIFLISVFRDQIMMVLLIRERFQSTAWLTLACAVFSLSVSWWAMGEHGVVGALIGLAAGELLNLGGIVVLTARLVRQELKPGVPPP